MADERPLGQILGWKRWAMNMLVTLIVAAVALHVAAAVIYLTPLKDIIFRDSGPVQQAYTPEQIQETADDIRRDIARKLRLKMGEVQEILATVTDIRARKARDHGHDAASLVTAGEEAGLALPVERQETLHDIYGAFAVLDGACIDAYEGWRAVTLATQQKIPLDRAREVTKVSRSQHRPGKQELLDGPARSLAEFRRFRDEVLFVRGEIDGIVVTAKRIRDLVLDIDAPELGSGQAIAIENSGTLYQGGSGEMEWGATVGPPLLADEIFESRASSLSQVNFQPHPGRKVSDRGEPMDWMYIDRWYCIGPFPNPGRQNLDKKFPPESVVDLDLSYEGKYGVLCWRPMRSPTLCVNPFDVDKYAIYYCFTEIWSDDEKDYWVAFGSDDYGKVWVNGKLIWASGKQPHAWIPDRGFRKVRFRKGPNQVLFKIENAGGTMGFSMVLRVAPISS